MNDGACVVDVEQASTWTGRVGGHGFVAEIQTNAVRGRSAHHPREEQGSRGEGEIGIARLIAMVLKYRRSGRALDARKIECGVDRKGWRSAHHVDVGPAGLARVTPSRIAIGRFRQPRLGS